MLMSIVLVSQLFDGSQRCYHPPMVAIIRHYTLENVIQLGFVSKTVPHTPNGLDHTAFVGASCTSCLYLLVIPVITCDRCTARRSQRRHGKVLCFVKDWNLSIASLSSCGEMQQNRVNSNGLNYDHRKFLRLFWVICGLGSGPTLVLASANQPDDAVVF